MTRSLSVSGCLLPLVLLLALALPVRAEAVVVVGHPGAKPLTREEILGIYLGRRSALRPLDWPSTSGAYLVFYRRLADRDPAQVRAAWAAVVFTGHGKPPQVLSSAEAIKQAIAADPRAIGYMYKNELDARVKPLFELED